MDNNLKDAELEKQFLRGAELGTKMESLQKLIEYMKVELVTIDSLTGVTPENFKDKQAQAWAWKKIINTVEEVIKNGQNCKVRLAEGEQRKKELRKKARNDD